MPTPRKKPTRKKAPPRPKPEGTLPEVLHVRLQQDPQQTLKVSVDEILLVQLRDASQPSLWHDSSLSELWEAMNDSSAQGAIFRLMLERSDWPRLEIVLRRPPIILQLEQFDY